MDKGIQGLLGIADDAKRIYRIDASDVEQEEFMYCQMLDQLVFGDKGYVDTLGPTWHMIGDPRFVQIENAFIVERRPVFGGDAYTGKQHMSEDGIFISAIADLEEYSEILGEGRYFYLLLEHPNRNCPNRLWLERIYPAVLASRGATAPTPGTDDLKCNCDYKEGHLYPEDLKNASDEEIWALIKQECPNYFTQAGNPNPTANRLFKLFKADLLGLISDYAPTPLVDAYVELDSGDILLEMEQQESGEAPASVFLEVDILEKALTFRATMRYTAAKILRSIGIESQLEALAGGDARLTDFERDRLLRMVYESNWPNDKPQLLIKLMNYISFTTKKPYEERLASQLSIASDRSWETVEGLKEGYITPITSYNEPQADEIMDSHSAIMAALLRSPIKQDLFIMWTNAEERSRTGKTDDDKMRMHKLWSTLTPIFTDPEFEVSEEKYAEYMDIAVDLGYFFEPTTKTVEESLGSEAEHAKAREDREARGEVRIVESISDPLESVEPCSVPLDK